MIKKINFFVFLWHLLINWNINKLFENEPERQIIIVDLYFKQIVITNDCSLIKKVLNSSESETCFIQNNLNVFLNHKKSINCVQSTSENWSNLHTSLKYVTNVNGKNNLTEIMQKNYYLLFTTNTFTNNTLTNSSISLNDCIENYMDYCWSEFLFGPNVDVKLYKQTRLDILKYMKHFHNSSLVKIPIIGYLYCKFARFYKQQELKDINKDLEKLIQDCNDFSFVGLLKINLDSQERFENTLLAILVQDFIYGFMLDFLLNQNSNSTKAVKESLKSSFLYPTRFRTNKEEIVYSPSEGLDQISIPKNSFFIYNLPQAELFFSYGPRTCVGMNLFNTIILPEIKNIKSWLTVFNYPNMRFLKKNDKQSLPKIPPVFEYKFTIPRNYLINNLPYSVTTIDQTNSSIKMYNVLEIYKNRAIFAYASKSIASIIQNRYNNNGNGEKIKGLVVPEMRGCSLAGAVSQLLNNLPIETIRKPGKIPGPTYSITFNKGYTNIKDTLEISVGEISGSYIIIDDGLATGNSVKACMELIEKKGGRVVGVCVVLKYTYCSSLDLNVPVHWLFKI